MKKLRADEERLTGSWRFVNGRMEADEVASRIEELTSGDLIQRGTAADGWETLYQDPSDGRLWELTHPQGHLQGGGPPELRVISAGDAERKYGIRVS